MERRSLGRTGLQTSRLGFGVSGVLGLKAFSAKKTVRLICSAAEQGVTLFDTAPFYGDGEAERRLGLALARLKTEQLVIITKTGTREDGRGRKIKDFSPTAIRKDVEASRRRLGRDVLDILLLHGFPTVHELDPCLDTLQELKETGKVRAIGACCNGARVQDAAVRSELDVLMCPYNVLHPEHGHAIAAAKTAGKGVIGIAPLAQGLYRKDFLMPRSLAGIWYAARALVKNRGALARAQKLKWLHETPGWDAPSLALAFSLANPHLDSAVMMTTRESHIASNVKTAAAPPPDAVLKAVKQTSRQKS